MKGMVTQIVKEGEQDVAGKKQPYQTVKVKVLEGAETNKELTITHGDQVNLQPGQKVSVGETIPAVRLSGS